MKNFALFFTRGISLNKWEQIGSLEREIAPYRKLAAHFDRLYFFTYGGRSDLGYRKLFPENVEIIPKPDGMPSTLYSMLLPFMHRKILRAAVLKTNQMDGSWAAVIAKKVSGAKLVVRCGYEWLRTLERAGKPRWKRFLARIAERFAYRNADAIILTSESDKKFVMDKFRIDASRVKVVPNYVDTDFFRPADSKKEKGRIIFVGRLEKEKNLFNLVAACEGLPVKIVIIGSGSLREKLESFAAEKSVRAEFKGNVPQRQLPEELNRSEIFVLPSLYEGNPKALLEAMACGLPCISSNIEGVREIITDRETGYLCGTDSASIRSALADLLGNGTMRERIGKNARDFIVNNFSFDKIIAKELLVYNSFSI